MNERLLAKSHRGGDKAKASRAVQTVSGAKKNFALPQMIALTSLAYAFLYNARVHYVMRKKGRFITWARSLIPDVDEICVMRARSLIFEKGFSVTGAGVKRILDAKSLLPV